jgi:hypothetical protein
MATMLHERCNPYGHGTDAGPRHLLGGVYGPEYEGKYKWVCERPAQGMFRFICASGLHRGQPVPLCYAHVAEITRRMSQLCPACAYPPEARALTEAIERDQRDLAVLNNRGAWGSAEADMLRQKIERMGHRMTELAQSGRTPNVAGRWEEVS